jgi:peptidoglycan/LPS O-acetylase OafA/YrhL
MTNGLISSERPSGHRPELDILRFFAFMGVFMDHTQPLSAEGLIRLHVPAALASWVPVIEHAGTYGVDVFFILSAYLITSLLLRERERFGEIQIGRFYVRRALRIWPIYYLTLAAVYLVPVLNPAHGLTAQYLPWLLLFAGNWAIIFVGNPWSAATPLWSISVEEQFYLLWPPLLARLSMRGMVIVAMMFCGVAAIALVLQFRWHFGSGEVWASSFTHLPALAAGITIAVATRKKLPTLSAQVRFLLIGVGVVCFVAMTTTQKFDQGERFSAMAAAGYPFMIAGAAAIFIGMLGARLRSPVLEYLGKISYGLYVYHLGCLFIVKSLGFVKFTMAPLALILTVVVAAASYHWIERPILRLKERFEARPRLAEAAMRDTA